MNIYTSFLNYRRLKTMENTITKTDKKLGNQSPIKIQIEKMISNNEGRKNLNDIIRQVYIIPDNTLTSKSNMDISSHRLKTERSLHGYSQIEMAKKLSISRIMYTTFENRNVMNTNKSVFGRSLLNRYYILAVSILFDISPLYLIGIIPDKKGFEFDLLAGSNVLIDHRSIILVMNLFNGKNNTLLNDIARITFLQDTIDKNTIRHILECIPNKFNELKFEEEYAKFFIFFKENELWYYQIEKYIDLFDKLRFKDYKLYKLILNLSINARDNYKFLDEEEIRL